MPPRYAYWTILIDGAATAFRAKERDELLPTFNQLRRKNTDVALRYFAQGKLWDSPEQADWARRNKGESRDRRSAAWRPGGTHTDPRSRAREGKERAAGSPKRDARPGSDEKKREFEPSGRQPRVGDPRAPRKDGWRPPSNRDGFGGKHRGFTNRETSQYNRERDSVPREPRSREPYKGDSYSRDSDTPGAKRPEGRWRDSESRGPSRDLPRDSRPDSRARDAHRDAGRQGGNRDWQSGQHERRPKGFDQRGPDRRDAWQKQAHGEGASAGRPKSEEFGDRGGFARKPPNERFDRHAKAPRFEDRPADERPRGKRPFDKRSFDDRTFDKRTFDNRSSEKRPFGKPAFDKKRPFEPRPDAGRHKNFGATGAPRSDHDSSGRDRRPAQDPHRPADRHQQTTPGERWTKGPRQPADRDQRFPKRDWRDQSGSRPPRFEERGPHRDDRSSNRGPAASDRRRRDNVNPNASATVKPPDDSSEE